MTNEKFVPYYDGRDTHLLAERMMENEDYRKRVESIKAQKANPTPIQIPRYPHPYEVQ